MFPVHNSYTLPGNIAEALDALNFAGRDEELDRRAASKVQKVRDLYAPLREPFEIGWAISKAAYLTEDIGSNYAGSTSLRLPKAFILNERVVPRVVKATVGRGAFFEAVPRKGDQQRAAKLQRDLLSWQLEECGFREKFTPLMRSTAIYGTGVAKRRWRYEVERVRTIRKVGKQTVISDEGVDVVPQYEPEDAMRVLFDGPDMDELDIYSVFIDPRSSCNRDTDILEERKVTRTWLLKEARAGRIRNLEQVFSPASGPLTSGAPGIDGTAGQEMRNTAMGLQPGKSTDQQEFVYRECWCEFAFEAEVGREEEAETEAALLCTVNGVPVRISGNPMPDHDKPYYFPVFVKITGCRYGVSLTKMNLALFVEANDTRNMAMDAKALAMVPMLTTRDPKMTGKVLQVEMGRIIVDPSGALKPITLTDTSQSGYIAEEHINRDLEDAFGAPATLSGAPLQGGGGSATEVATTQEEAGVRIASYGYSVEDTFLKKILCGMSNDNRQFLDDEKQVRVEGEDGFEWPWVTPADAQAECDFQMLGASQMQTRAMLGAQYAQIVPLLQAHEQQMMLLGRQPNVNWTFLYRTLFRDVFGFPHPELVILPSPDETKRPLLAEEMIELIAQGHMPRMDPRTDFQNALEKVSQFLVAVEGRIDYRLEKKYREFLLDLWGAAQKKIEQEMAEMQAQGQVGPAGPGAGPAGSPPPPVGPGQRDGRGTETGRRTMVAARGGPMGRGRAA